MQSPETSPSESSRFSSTVSHIETKHTSPCSGEAHSTCDKERSIGPAPSTFLASSTSPSQILPKEWRRGAGFWRSFIAICFPLLLGALEGSVTNTALTTVSNALDLGTKFSWVATAFLLTSTVSQPLYSQLGDIWGRKRPIMTAVILFATGSAICSGAQSGAVLLLGRIVQGLGAGGVDLLHEMILCDIIPMRKRGPYLAIKHAARSVGATLGPLLGGVFAERGWRWCFIINIPLCAISLVIIWFWLSVGGGVSMKDTTFKTEFKTEFKKLDYIGSGILTASIVMILVPLSTGGAPHLWSSPQVVVPSVFGFLGLIAFGFWECSARCTHPVMPPHVFSNRTTNIGFVLTVIHGFMLYGFQFFLPPFFQGVKGSSPSKSGIEVLPTTLAIVLLAAVGGPILSCWGKYKPMHTVGFACATLGLALCTMLNAKTQVFVWIIIQLITAIGIGIVISTMLPAIQVKLPESTTGATAGSWAFLRGIGSLFGVAIPGAIFNVRFTQLLHTIPSEAARSELANGHAYQHARASFTKKFGTAAEAQIINVFTQSFRSVWTVFAVVAAVGFLLTWFEKEYKMRRSLDTAYGLKSSQSATATAASIAITMPVTSGTVTWVADSENEVEVEKKTDDIV